MISAITNWLIPLLIKNMVKSINSGRKCWENSIIWNCWPICSQMVLWEKKLRNTLNFKLLNLKCRWNQSKNWGKWKEWTTNWGKRRKRMNIWWMLHMFRTSSKRKFRSQNRSISWFRVFVKITEKMRSTLTHWSL